MDPLTHVALGVATAVAIAPSAIPIRHRVVVGAVAGLLPDADLLLSSAHDPLFNLEFHRHFTHSLVFSPVLAAVAAAVGWLISRRTPAAPTFRHLLVPAWGAVLSHLVCDAWTSYGTHLGWPFTDHRVAWDLVSIVDPLLTLPLLAAIAISLRKHSRRPAVAGLAWVAIYLVAAGVQQSRVRRALDQWLAAPQAPTPAPERITVKPSFANIIVWRAVHQHGTTVHATAIRSAAGPPRLMPGESTTHFPTPAAAAHAFNLPPASTQARDIARFHRLSDGWIGRHPHHPDLIGDLRYASLPHAIAPLWAIRITPDQPDQPVAWAPQRSVQKTPWQSLWHMITGQAFDEADESPPHRGTSPSLSE